MTFTEFMDKFIAMLEEGPVSNDGGAAAQRWVERMEQLAPEPEETFTCSYCGNEVWPDQN